MSNIMTSVTTDIANAVDKVVNDVTTAAETAFPYIADIAFEFALHTAVAALLS